jgi:hypothetical protein
LVDAAHEIPRELGDFGILVHIGWPPRKALAYNVISAATFLVGGIVARHVGGRGCCALRSFCGGRLHLQRQRRPSSTDHVDDWIRV